MAGTCTLSRKQSSPEMRWHSATSGARAARSATRGELADPLALAAGVGVGVSSSAIPYVCDQLAMARLPRATYALMVSLLPATATAIGVVVLTQVPSVPELLGVALSRSSSTSPAFDRAWQ